MRTWYVSLHARAALVKVTSAVAVASICVIAWRILVDNQIGGAIECFSTIAILAATVWLLPPSIPAGQYFTCVPKWIRLAHIVVCCLLAAHTAVALLAFLRRTETRAIKRLYDLRSTAEIIPIIILVRQWAASFTSLALLLVRDGILPAWSAARLMCLNLGLTYLFMQEVLLSPFFEPNHRRPVGLYVWIATLILVAAVLSPQRRAALRDVLLSAPLGALRSSDQDRAGIARPAEIDLTSRRSESSESSESSGGAAAEAASSASGRVHDLSAKAVSPRFRNCGRSPCSRACSSACSSAMGELDNALDTVETCSTDEVELYPLRPQFYQEECSDKESEAVTYLQPEERIRFELVVSDGRLVDRFNKPLAPGTPKSGMFVLASYGALLANFEAEQPGFHHSSFVAGEPVAAAGCVTVCDGLVLSISNESGHYVPPPSSLNRVMESLAKLGVAELPSVHFDIVHSEAYDAPATSVKPRRSTCIEE